MLSPDFADNNINIPTRNEINARFGNFRRQMNSYTVWARKVISRFPNVMYALENIIVVDRDEHDWMLEDIYYHTLHIIYTDNHIIHHKMFKFTGDSSYNWNTSIFQDADLYEEVQIKNFDYNTIRLFRIPALVLPPSRI